MSEDVTPIKFNYVRPNEYAIINPPNPVGWWVLYPGASWQFRFSMFIKPTDQQIKNTEELLGWKWKDNEHTK